MGGSAGEEAAEWTGVRALPGWEVSGCIVPAPRYDSVEEYRRGAPLREIAAASGFSLENLCLELAFRSRSEDLHLQRSRSVRRAIRAADTSITDNQRLVHQLWDTDLTAREIPVVLKALDRIDDVDYVGDLLEYPGPPSDGKVLVPPQPTASRCSTRPASITA
ncbi:hypothetical protein ACQ7FX_02470 [Arthrobacter koreensis]|uniref:hypothetical protein n=1 Tax=Arthrobacter koreensis TaxID=199136 RepID=UPI003D907547